MKVKLITMLLISVLGTSSVLLGGVQKELIEDLVKIIDNKMVVEEYGLYKIEIDGYKPFSTQIKYHIEAPNTGFMSRDNFVALYVEMKRHTLFMFFSGHYDVNVKTFLQNEHYEEIEEPIGNVDFEINIYATKLGIQLEMINGSNGTSKRETVTWEELDK